MDVERTFEPLCEAIRLSTWIDVSCRLAILHGLQEPKVEWMSTYLSTEHLVGLANTDVVQVGLTETNSLHTPFEEPLTGHIV